LLDATERAEDLGAARGLRARLVTEDIMLQTEWHHAS
jgi:hypothetical protein